MSDNVSQARRYEYKAEMKQLLNIIIHSLYTNTEVFIRELVSNASDALNKVRFIGLTESEHIDTSNDLRIDIILDNENQTFAIEDTGIGMTENDLVNQIGTVASSGTLSFLKELSENQKTLDAQLIGQFGVGFYSVFMVTDSIEIETKHIVKDSRAYRWKSTGEDTFTIEEIERGNTGTKIYFKLSDEHKHFAEPDTVKRILKKYSNFVDFPIYVNGEIVNTVSAIWHKKKEEVKEEEANEFYSFISGDYNKTLGYLHFSVEGNINLEAMLFIPEKAADLFFREENEHGLQLYSGKVFISDKINELLPDYLKFIRGVVDTVDLPLNVSRELTQSTPLTAKIRNILTGKILTFLEEWSVENAVKYRKFFDSFGSLLKIGLNTDFDNKNRILELMRYDSTFLNNNEKTTLKDYVSRMKENQKHIYYIIGENREQILKNPNMEYFLKNNIEILILTDPADYITFPYIASYESFNIQSIERAGIDLESEPTNEEELNPETTQSLIQFIKEVLSTEIEDVVASKRLVDSPVTLVVGEKGFDPQMEKIMQQIDKSFTGSKRILEINTSHPLIKNIWRLYIADTNHDFLRKTVQHLYEGALIIEGLLKNPNDYIQRANEILLKATDIN